MILGVMVAYACCCSFRSRGCYYRQCSGWGHKCPCDLAGGVPGCLQRHHRQIHRLLQQPWWKTIQWGHHPRPMSETELRSLLLIPWVSSRCYSRGRARPDRSGSSQTRNPVSHHRGGHSSYWKKQKQRESLQNQRFDHSCGTCQFAVDRLADDSTLKTEHRSPL